MSSLQKKADTVCWYFSKWHSSLLKRQLTQWAFVDVLPETGDGKVL